MTFISRNILFPSTSFLNLLPLEYFTFSLFYSPLCMSSSFSPLGLSVHLPWSPFFISLLPFPSCPQFPPTVESFFLFPHLHFYPPAFYYSLVPSEFSPHFLYHFIIYIYFAFIPNCYPTFVMLLNNLQLPLLFIQHLFF